MVKYSQNLVNVVYEFPLTSVSMGRFVLKMPSFFSFFTIAIFPRDTVTMMHEYFVYMFRDNAIQSESDEWAQIKKEHSLTNFYKDRSLALIICNMNAKL